MQCRHISVPEECASTVLACHGAGKYKGSALVATPVTHKQDLLMVTMIAGDKEHSFLSEPRGDGHPGVGSSKAPVAIC